MSISFVPFRSSGAVLPNRSAPCRRRQILTPNRVDQPISTGFAVGTPTATNENDVADQFLAFLANFEDQFGIKNYKVYLTGESYAGMYIPYIGAGMLERNDTQYFNLSGGSIQRRSADLAGALIYDPSINGQIPATAVPFIQANSRLLSYNQSFFSDLESIHASCGFPEYLDQYYAYPPNGTQPPITTNKTCQVIAIAGLAEVDLNPCFSIYDIVRMSAVYKDEADAKSSEKHVPLDMTPSDIPPTTRTTLQVPRRTSTAQTSNKHSTLPISTGSWTMAEEVHLSEGAI